MSTSMFHPMVRVGLALLATLAFLSSASAQSTGDTAPPERVGRLAYLEGEVQAWDDDQQSWQPALLNLPVTSRSAFGTASRSRAEIRVGSAALRMDGDSHVTMLRLDDGGTDVELSRGSVSIRLRAQGDADWQIAIRDAVLSLASPGQYRLEVNPERGTLIARIVEGRAQIAGSGSRNWLTTGQEHAFDLNSLQPIGQGPLNRTPFDDWVAMRDREQDRLQAWRYVSPEMTGAESLDAAGDWRPDPTHGVIWFPRTVPVGWSPYTTGRWVWMPPWGWHWVDDAPWGFAPFHYGRWILAGSSWGWVPGPYVRRPVYAPALVGFHGPGGVVSFAPSYGPPPRHIRGPGVYHGPQSGWFPLAPGEVWHPPYRVGGTYLQNLNRGHSSGVGQAIAGSVIGGAASAGAGAAMRAPAYRFAQQPSSIAVMPSVPAYRPPERAQRLDPQRLDGQRVDGQRVDGQRLDDKRLDHQRLEGQSSGRFPGTVYGTTPSYPRSAPLPGAAVTSSPAMPPAPAVLPMPRHDNAYPVRPPAALSPYGGGGVPPPRERVDQSPLDRSVMPRPYPGQPPAQSPAMRPPEIAQPRAMPAMPAMPPAMPPAMSAPMPARPVAPPPQIRMPVGPERAQPLPGGGGGGGGHPGSRHQ